MKKGFSLCVLVLSVIGILSLPLASAASARLETANISTGLNDQESVAVTVYNSDIGLIKDIRQLSLPSGLTELRFGEVAAKIMPQQVSLLSADRVPVSKRYIFTGSPQYFHSRHTGVIPKQKVGVFVELANKKDNNLGMPLPKGTLRVYKADSDGSLQFIGEDRIDHTPKDEMIKIKMGDAFDVVAERKQTDWRKIADNIYEAAFEISLRNHKDEPVRISVIEPMLRDWEILTSSHTHKKIEAHTAQFEIPVAKDSETKLTYRARYKF